MLKKFWLARGERAGRVIQAVSFLLWAGALLCLFAALPFASRWALALIAAMKQAPVKPEWPAKWLVLMLSSSAACAFLGYNAVRLAAWGKDIVLYETPALWRRFWPQGFAIYAAAALFCGLFGYFFVLHEDPLYSWDYGGYWLQNIFLAEGWFKAFKDTFFKFLTEVRASSYNPVPTISLWPVVWLFGRARAPYIAALGALYAAPAILMVWLLFIKQNLPRAKRAVKLFFAVLALLFSPFYYPYLHGYPDIGAFISFMALYLLTLRADFSQKLSWRRIALFAVLLWLPFLFRRWLLIGLLCWALCAAMLSAAKIFLQPDKSCRKRNLAMAARNLGLIGVLAAIFAIIVQGNLVLSVLSSNYKDAYQAWAARSRSAEAADLLRYFGPFCLSFAVIGLWGAWRARKTEREAFLSALFMLDSLILIFFIFTHTQRFDEHHTMFLAFPLFYLFALGIKTVLSALKASWARLLGAGALLAACIWQFFCSFNPQAPSPLGGRLFSGHRIAPLQYQIDEAALRRLRQDALAAADGRPISVYMASMALNEALFNVPLFLTGNDAAALSFKSVPPIDKRDGLAAMIMPLMQPFAIAAVPTQNHLPKGTSTLIDYPSEAITSGQGIGAAYRRIGPAYQMAPGIEAFLYRKTRAFTQEELNTLLERFYARYPEWREEYPADWFQILTERAVFE